MLPAMDRAALPGDVVSAGGVTLTDGAMAVGDRDGAIFTGGVMFGDGTMMASAALLMDGVEGAIFIGEVTSVCKQMVVFSAEVIGEMGGPIFAVKSLFGWGMWAGRASEATSMVESTLSR